MEDSFFADEEFLNTYQVVSISSRKVSTANGERLQGQYIINESRNNFLDEVYFFRVMGRLPLPGEEGAAWGGRAGGRDGGGRGRGRGGRGGRGGSRACFNCGDPDHMSWECPKPKKERGGAGGE